VNGKPTANAATDGDRLAGRFEAHRPALRAVANRILGSPAEADDAVQEAWLRLRRTDTAGVHNLGGWLTTTVGRVCLDMLRTRQSQREEPHGIHAPEPAAAHHDRADDPEHQAVLAESVGMALRIILETLGPAERLALVFHDMFAVPFGDIAPLVGRSPTAVRQLACRARRRIEETATTLEDDPARHHEAVHAFRAATRDGDFTALLTMLSPGSVTFPPRGPS
jgi:RNA polymerase sigma factor (sigma-70 family)